VQQDNLLCQHNTVGLVVQVTRYSYGTKRAMYNVWAHYSFRYILLRAYLAVFYSQCIILMMSFEYVCTDGYIERLWLWLDVEIVSVKIEVLFCTSSELKVCRVVPGDPVFVWYTYIVAVTCENTTSPSITVRHASNHVITGVPYLAAYRDVYAPVCNCVSSNMMT